MKAIFHIIFAVFMMSCSNDQKVVESTSVQEEESDSKDYWSKNSCLRGVPTSTLYSKELARYKFELKEDKGVEIAVWENGDSLIVQNKGCEVFWLTYTFYLNGSELQDNNLDLIHYCFERVEKIDLAPIDLKGAMDLMNKLKANNENLELGVEHYLKEDNVSEMFEINEIDLKENSSKVVFSFAIGKL